MVLFLCMFLTFLINMFYEKKKNLKEQPGEKAQTRHIQDRWCSKEGSRQILVLCYSGSIYPEDSVHSFHIHYCKVYTVPNPAYSSKSIKVALLLKMEFKIRAWQIRILSLLGLCYFFPSYTTS